jgi:hypothetical protein
MANIARSFGIRVYLHFTLLGAGIVYRSFIGLWSLKLGKFLFTILIRNYIYFQRWCMYSVPTYLKFYQPASLYAIQVYICKFVATKLVTTMFRR